jgi:hypothetical protein
MLNLYEECLMLRWVLSPGEHTSRFYDPTEQVEYLLAKTGRSPLTLVGMADPNTSVLPMGGTDPCGLEVA